MTEEKLAQFVDDFYAWSGKNLETELSMYPQGPVSAMAFVTRAENTVLEEIRASNPGFDPQALTGDQEETIRRAVLEQVLYVLSAGDLSLMSGYDPVTNAVLPIAELRGRIFAPAARRILRNGGLLYRGLRRQGSGYLSEREGWR